jgi:hypothetical protein
LAKVCLNELNCCHRHFIFIVLFLNGVCGNDTVGL